MLRSLGSSAIHFITVMGLPIVPYEVFAVSGGSTLPPASTAGGWQLLRTYAGQSAATLPVTVVLVKIPHIPILIRHWLYTFNSCMFLSGKQQQRTSSASSLQCVRHVHIGCVAVVVCCHLEGSFGLEIVIQSPACSPGPSDQSRCYAHVHTNR